MHWAISTAPQSISSSLHTFHAFQKYVKIIFIYQLIPLLYEFWLDFRDSNAKKIFNIFEQMELIRNYKQSNATL